MQRPAFCSTPAAPWHTSRGAAAANVCASRRSFHGVAPRARAPRARVPPHAPAPVRIVAFDDGNDDDPQIHLRDVNTGRTLACGVEHTITFEGNSYVLCYPVDDVVAFADATVAEGEDLAAVEDPVLVDRLFPIAEAVLAEQNIDLRKSAFVLTADDLNEVDEDEGEDEEDEEDGEGDVEVLAEFLHEGKQFLVVKPVYPVLLLAKEGSTGFSIVEGDELQRVSPAVDAYIESVEKGDN